MALLGLKGPINFVTILGQKLSVTPPIPGYLGDTLHIRDAMIDTNNVLVVTIDDLGPPTMPRFPSTVLAGVSIRISYKTGPYSVGTVMAPIKLGTMPLMLTGTISFPDPKKYNNAEVIPEVSEWVSPQRGLEYIVVQQAYVVPKPGDAAANQLRWFSTPIEATAVTPSVDIVPMPTGPGVQGPFGLETPSP